MDKVKRIVVYLLLLLIFIMGEYNLAQKTVYVYTKMNIEISDVNILSVNGYDVDGDFYKKDGDDPQILINTGLDWVTDVDIELNAPLEESTQVQVYYMDKDGNFKEKNSDIFEMKKGSNSYSIDVNHSISNIIRLDIDEDFSLKKMSIEGENISFSKKRGIVYILACILFDIVCFGLFIKKKIEEKICHILRILFDGIKTLWDKVNSFLYAMGQKCHITIVKIYLILSILMGVFYSFAIPMVHVPDEPAHVMYLEEAYGVHGIYDQYLDVAKSTGSMDVVRDVNKNVDLDKYLSKANIRFDKDNITFSGKITYKVVAYFPAAAGLFLGYLFNLPIMWCVQLGELFSVAFMVIMGYIALKIIPKKRELLCMIMLIPINIQQCASYNYDAVLLPTCYVFVAYILFLKYRKENVRWKNIGIVLLLVGIIATVKVLYILLALMFLIIPIDKLELKVGKLDLILLYSKHKKICWCIFAVLICGAGYVLSNISYVLALRTCFLEPLQALTIFKNTFHELGYFYLSSMIGRFGWLESSMPDWFVYMSLIMILLLSQIKDSKRLSKGDRIIIGVSNYVIYILVIVTMITWSFYIADIDVNTIAGYRSEIYNIHRIDGVQGRYFLPLCMGMLLPFDSIVKIEKKETILVQIIYYVLLMIIPTMHIIQRYWL